MNIVDVLTSIVPVIAGGIVTYYLILLINKIYGRLRPVRQADKPPKLRLASRSRAGGSVGAGFFYGFQVAANQHCPCLPQDPWLAFASVFLIPIPLTLIIGVLFWLVFSKIEPRLERRRMRSVISHLSP